MFTDVSGQPISPLFKGQAVQIYLTECHLSKSGSWQGVTRGRWKYHTKLVLEIIDELEGYAGMGKK
jgi:hypothetical protein